MEEADLLSDRISIIDHGKIIVTGSADELKNKLGKDLIYLETSNNKSCCRDLKITPVSKICKEDLQISKSHAIREDVTHILAATYGKNKRAGIDITSVNIKKPSMDDVFVHYTGHELREGEVQRKSMKK